MTTVIEIIQQELTQTESANIIVKSPPYHHQDRIKRKIEKSTKNWEELQDSDMTKITELRLYSMPII